MTELEKMRLVIDSIDEEMARLFTQRMDAVRQVSAYKQQHNLPIEDAAREAAMLAQREDSIACEAYRPYYARFLRSVIKASKDYQADLSNDLYVSTAQGRYPVYVRQGGIHRAGEWFDWDRKVLIVTDSGVPEDYVMTIASQCGEAFVFVLEQGESSKCVDIYRSILEALTDNAFSRTDCVVAVGGGVVGDVAGFVAASYMRGVYFYNIPTTVLAQVDASIGGKTAVNLSGFKNMVGAFYAPRGVLIDINLLQTLPQRHIANGVAEIIKMALTHDAELFSLLESADAITEDIVRRALLIKKHVVEADEYESGQRKALNFGHTLGHAIESVSEEWLHGECVSLGMLPMCSSVVRERLARVLDKWDLPSTYQGDVQRLLEICRHDKKVSGDFITIVYVPEVGVYTLKTLSLNEWEDMVKEVMG